MHLIYNFPFLIMRVADFQSYYLNKCVTNFADLKKKLPSLVLMNR